MIIETFNNQPYDVVYPRQLEITTSEPFVSHLMIGEHLPVITTGRAQTSSSNILTPDSNIPIIETQRGGDVTYHGPGQLVLYPIMKLENEQRDLHRHLRQLEEIVISSLKEIGVEGERKEGFTGVWVQDKKVCSIGVAVKNRSGAWITYHGLALNVCCDLTPFQLINPCGLESGVMANVIDFMPTKTEPMALKKTLADLLVDYAQRYMCAAV